MAKSSSNGWHALVQYADKDSNTEIVSADYVQKLTPPAFDSEHLYDVFWTPDAKDSLKAARTRMSDIPTFRVGAGYEGPGFYKARVILESKTHVLSMSSQ